MPVEIKGVPKVTCKHVPNKTHPGIYQADCCGEWIVLQEPFKYCVYCGHVIERNPPPKPRSIA